MISVQEALDIIMHNIPSRTVERVALENACDRVLAETIVAPEPLPRFTNSAMDGYAVRWADVEYAQSEAPAKLTVVGESRAGAPFTHQVIQGQAVRISTGAMLPAGADTVTPQEDTIVGDATVAVTRVRKRGAHIRIEGEEIASGAPALAAGAQLHPAHIGLLASFGIQEVETFRAPKVAIIVTGSEIADLRAHLGPGQIRDSNSPMLRAAVARTGASVVACERIDDDLAGHCRVIRRVAESADIILCSGGVSVGPHDLVKEAAEESGFQRLFWKVRQKPGKPLYFARKHQTLLFGLPGNPVSAYMCFMVYVLPVIRTWAGKSDAKRIIIGAAGAEIRNDFDRAEFKRVAIQPKADGTFRIQPLQRQGSHMLTSVTHAEGFIQIPAATVIGKGDSLKAYAF